MATLITQSQKGGVLHYTLRLPFYKTVTQWRHNGDKMATLITQSQEVKRNVVLHTTLLQMPTQWRQNGDKNETKWRHNGDKMAILITQSQKCDV
jgi:hypothetical protein